MPGNHHQGAGHARGQCQPVPFLVDGEKQLALANQLVVMHRHGDDSSGNIGRHVDDTGAYPPIPGPGGVHVTVPQGDANDHGADE